MRLSVRDVRSLATLSLTIDAPVTVVVGANGEGKSTLALCLAAALVPDAKLGLGKAARQVALVREGAEAGEVAAFASNGSTRVSWPEGDLLVEGTPPRASRVAVGLVRPARLQERERAGALVAALRADPTAQEWERACHAAGLSLPATTGGWLLVSQHGWDGAVIAAQERAREGKRRWQGLTAIATYSAKVAADWQPAGWERDLAAMPLAEAQQALDDAKAEHAALLELHGVTNAERERLRALAEGVGDLEDALAAAERQALSAATTARDWKNKLRHVAVARMSAPCPHCKRAVEVWHEDNGEAVTLKAPVKAAGVDPKTAEDWRTQANAAIRAASEARLVVDNLAVRLREATSARDRLAGLPPADGDALTRAERRLEMAGAQLAALRVAQEAREVHEQVRQWSLVAELAAPTGCRASKLHNVLTLVNGGLEELSQAAGWPLVTIDADLVPTMGGRPQMALSASEQWALDAILALEIARRDGSELAILDAADVLDTGHRNGLLAAIAAAGVPVLLLLTEPVVRARHLAARLPVWHLHDGHLDRLES